MGKILYALLGTVGAADVHTGVGVSDGARGGRRVLGHGFFSRILPVIRVCGGDYARSLAKPQWLLRSLIVARWNTFKMGWWGRLLRLGIRRDIRGTLQLSPRARTPVRDEHNPN